MPGFEIGNMVEIQTGVKIMQMTSTGPQAV